MKTRLYAGIDPGVSGAVGFVLADGSFSDVLDMPTLATTTGRRQIDFAALAAILRDHAPAFVLVERVGTSSTRSWGRAWPRCSSTTSTSKGRR